MDKPNFPTPGSPVSAKITRGGIYIPMSSFIHPGDEEYRVVLPTMCGENVATVDIGCSIGMAAVEFVRRVRIVATIQHWQQNACAKCGELLRTATTRSEKEWINCSDPTIGPALGFGDVVNGGPRGLIG